MAGRARTTKTAPSRVNVAMRRAEAIKMRIAAVPVPEIMKRLGYRSTGAVYQDISRALEAYVGEPADELRAIEVARMDATLVRLDEREAVVLRVRDRTHITVNNGRVITVPGKDESGKDAEIPLIDDEPVLRANAQLMLIERMRADVQTRRAKLIGINAPERFEMLTIDQISAEIEKLNAEMAAMDSHADADANPG